MHKSNCRGASRHCEHPTHWLICAQVAKHDKLIKEPEKCFPHLKGFDPNAPEPTGIAVAQAAAKKKVKKVRLRRLRLDPRAPPARLTALYPHAEEGRGPLGLAGRGPERG